MTDPNMEHIEGALHDESLTNGAITASTNTPPQQDVAMTDVPLDQAASPFPAVNAPSPAAPGRTGTPVQSSRAASAHPDPGLVIPSEAAPHGDLTRRYLNTKVTSVLLEGMKQIAKDQPSDPLRVLGEFLIQRSRELETSSNS